MSMYKMFAVRANYQNLDHITRHFLEQFDVLLKMFDERLGVVPFLAGEELSAADIMAMYPLTTWAGTTGSIASHSRTSLLTCSV